MKNYEIKPAFVCDGYEYNDCDVCMNAKVFAEYEGQNYLWRYNAKTAKSKNGFIYGFSISSNESGYSSPCVYEINEKPTEKDAQLAALMEIENFLNKQEKSHELNKMIESVKKQCFGLIHVQLSLF